jgi:tetratricopeptide (TPR) repeat protein
MRALLIFSVLCLGCFICRGQEPTVTIKGYEAVITYPNGKTYSTSRDEAAGMFYQLCLERYKQGKKDAAAECIQLAYLCDPKNALVLYMRGVLKKDANKIDEAIADLKQSLLYNKQNAKAWALLGACEGMKAEYAEAAEALKKSWSLDAHDAQVAYQLGQTLVVLNRTKEAKKYLKYAVKHGIAAAQEWLDKCDAAPKP